MVKVGFASHLEGSVDTRKEDVLNSIAKLQRIEHERADELDCILKWLRFWELEQATGMQFPVKSAVLAKDRVDRSPTSLAVSSAVVATLLGVGWDW
jgi:hypothetical protein